MLSRCLFPRRPFDIKHLHIWSPWRFCHFWWYFWWCCFLLGALFPPCAKLLFEATVITHALFGSFPCFYGLELWIHTDCGCAGTKPFSTTGVCERGLELWSGCLDGRILLWINCGNAPFDCWGHRDTSLALGFHPSCFFLAHLKETGLYWRNWSRVTGAGTDHVWIFSGGMIISREERRSGFHVLPYLPHMYGFQKRQSSQEWRTVLCTLKTCYLWYLVIAVQATALDH